MDSMAEEKAEKRMDDYLKSIGLLRKKTPKDGSCLFRAVAEQVLHCQSLHTELRARCVDFLRHNRDTYKDFVEGDFEEHLHKLQDPQHWVGEVEINALAVLYKRDFFIYRYPDKPAENITEMGFEDKVQLCFLHGNHYDSVYTISRVKNAALCQSILYELLYDGVFNAGPLPLVRRAGKASDKLTDDNMAAAPSSDESDPETEQPLWVEEVAKQTPKHSGHTNRGRAQTLFLSERVRRSLNPTLLRNVEYDVWITTKKTQQKLDFRFAAGMHFTIGARCQVTLETGRRSHCGTIKQVSPSNGPVTVYVEELGKQFSVPFRDLRPLSDDRSWTSVVSKTVTKNTPVWAECGRGRGRARGKTDPPSLRGSSGNHFQSSQDAGDDPSGRGTRPGKPLVADGEQPFSLSEQQRSFDLEEMQLRDEFSFPALGKSPAEDAKAPPLPPAGQRPTSCSPPAADDFIPAVTSAALPQRSASSPTWLSTLKAAAPYASIRTVPSGAAHSVPAAAAAAPPSSGSVTPPCPSPPNLSSSSAPTFIAPIAPSPGAVRQALQQHSSSSPLLSHPPLPSFSSRPPPSLPSSLPLPRAPIQQPPPVLTALDGKQSPLSVADVAKGLDLPGAHIPQTQLPQTSLPQSQLSQSPVPQNQLPQTSLPQNQLSQAPAPQNQSSQTPVPQNQLSQSPVPQNHLSQSPVPQNQLSQTPVPQNQLPQTPLPPNQLPQTSLPQNQSTQSSVSQNQLPEDSVAPTSLPQNQSTQALVPQNELPQTAVPQNQLPQTSLPQNQLPLTSLPQTHNSVPQTHLPHTPVLQTDVPDTQSNPSQPSHPHPYASLPVASPFRAQTYQNSQAPVASPPAPLLHPEGQAAPPQPHCHPPIQDTVPLQQMSQLYLDLLYPGFPLAEGGAMAPTPGFSTSHTGDDLPQNMNILRWFFNLGVKAYSYQVLPPLIYLLPLKQSYDMQSKAPARPPTPSRATPPVRTPEPAPPEPALLEPALPEPGPPDSSAYLVMPPGYPVNPATPPINPATPPSYPTMPTGYPGTPPRYPPPTLQAPPTFHQGPYSASIPPPPWHHQRPQAPPPTNPSFPAGYAQTLAPPQGYHRSAPYHLYPSSLGYPCQAAPPTELQGLTQQSPSHLVSARGSAHLDGSGGLRRSQAETMSRSVLLQETRLNSTAMMKWPPETTFNEPAVALAPVSPPVGGGLVSAGYHGGGYHAASFSPMEEAWAGGVGTGAEPGSANRRGYRANQGRWGVRQRRRYTGDAAAAHAGNTYISSSYRVKGQRRSY